MRWWEKEIHLFGKPKEEKILVRRKYAPPKTLMEKLKEAHPELSPEVETLARLLVKEIERVDEDASRIRRGAGIPPYGSGGGPY